jgi:hypothetical protein
MNNPLNKPVKFSPIRKATLFTNIPLKTTLSICLIPVYFFLYSLFFTNDALSKPIKSNHNKPASQSGLYTELREICRKPRIFSCSLINKSPNGVTLEIYGNLLDWDIILTKSGPADNPEYDSFIMEDNRQTSSFYSVSQVYLRPGGTYTKAFSPGIIYYDFYEYSKTSKTRGPNKYSLSRLSPGKYTLFMDFHGLDMEGSFVRDVKSTGLEIDLP